MKTNKLIAGFMAVAIVASNFAFVSNFSAKADSAENMAAYEWALDNGLTSMSSYSAFNFEGTTTREAAAKFAVKGAEALGADLSSDQTCDYSDLSSADQSLVEYINAGCEQGIFKAQAEFNPKGTVTRAMAELIVARIVYGMDEVAAYATDNNLSEYAAARELLMADEIVKVEVPADSAVKRGHFTLMFYRLADMDVVDPTDPTDPTDPVAPKAGSLDVSLSSNTPASAEVPASSSGLPVAKFEFTAGGSDVTVSSVKLLRKGFSDSTTLEGVALVADTGRVSKARDENSTDGTVELTLNNGGYVVKANTTVVFTVVATVANAAAAANDTFGFQVMNVSSSAESSNVSSAISPLMRVSSQNAPTVDFEANGSSSDVKIGQAAVELAKFKITNNNSDQTVTVKSLTFEEVGTADENTDLKNFALFIDNVQFGSTVASTANKYVTFSDAAGKVINTNNNVKLVIKADIVGGANKTVRFEIDNELDFIADGSKFGPGVGINQAAPIQSAANVNIDAGEVTLDDVDATSDKMREDKDDVVLGKIRVTNVAGKSLELQQFGVKATLTAGAAQVNGVAMTLANLFDNFELYNESNGATYELTLGGNVFSDNDLNIALAQGTTTFAIRADTATNITNFDAASVKLDLSAGAIGANGGLYIIETEDDTQVTDITPSALSWKTIKGSEAAATVALTPLSNVSRVRGSDDVVALQFTVEADESSALTMDEAKVYVTANGTAATNQQIAAVALYKGTVDPANLLKKVSGTNLAAGVATFNGFNTTIAADATQAYVVTVSIVDGADAVTGSPIRVALDNDASTVNTNLSLSLEDDDNDTVDAAYPATTSNRNVAVTDAGSIASLEAKTSNATNEFDKVILAGTSVAVVAYDVKADNEAIDVETITVTYAGPVNLNTAGATASLYLGNTLVATAQNSKINGTTILFDNLTTAIIPTTTTELKLVINTLPTGKEQSGLAGIGMSITNVAFSDMQGVTSDKEPTTNVVAGVTNSSVDSAKTFDIVPVTLLASNVSNFGLSDGTAEFKLTTAAGTNTTAAGTTLDVEFDTLTLEVTSFQTAGTIQVFNSNGDAVSTAVAVAANGNLTITLNPGELVSNPNETYRIETTAEASFRVAKNGVAYIVNGNTYSMKMDNSVAMGAYDNNN